LLAKQDIPEKVQKYAAQVGVEPVGIKINGAKSRWGSCSAKKSLNFSWRLMMADDEVIDYVVVHELAHIKEMNHSPAFWAIVSSVLPDYKQRQTKLKALHKKLSEEDWD
jgi:predicted metal-dependent hydrolase